MAKMKKIGVLTALIMLFAISLGVVTACSQGDYKVTFYDGETVITEKWVNSGEKIEEFTPEDVGYEKEGFAFDAWYATSDFTFGWCFDTEITENKKRIFLLVFHRAGYSSMDDSRRIFGGRTFARDRLERRHKRRESSHEICRQKRIYDHD